MTTSTDCLVVEKWHLEVAPWVDTDVEIFGYEDDVVGGIKGLTAYEAARYLDVLGFNKVVVTDSHPTDVWKSEEPIMDIADYIDLEGFRYPEIGFGGELDVIVLVSEIIPVAFFLRDDGVCNDESCIAVFWRDDEGDGEEDE